MWRLVHAADFGREALKSTKLRLKIWSLRWKPAELDGRALAEDFGAFQGEDGGLKVVTRGNDLARNPSAVASCRVPGDAEKKESPKSVSFITRIERRELRCCIAGERERTQEKKEGPDPQTLKPSSGLSHPANFAPMRKTSPALNIFQRG
jgi:hypothetical protein